MEADSAVEREKRMMGGGEKQKRQRERERLVRASNIHLCAATEAT